MLDDVEPYREWLRKEHPSETAQDIAARFIGEITERPWSYPSVPLDVRGQPDYEIRVADLVVPDESRIRIRYMYQYIDNVVDLLHVTQLTETWPTGG